MSLDEVGERCAPPLGKTSIFNYEKQASSMSVSNVLRIVNALKIAEGAADQVRLARFFLGPDAVALEDAIEAHRQAEASHRRQRRQLERIEGRGRPR